VEDLENLKRKLEVLGTNFRFFFQSIQHSLIFLFAMNANCLLGGIYSYTYYWNTWHVIFEDRKRRIFYAANASIYACIAGDYICLMVVLFMIEKEVKYNIILLYVMQICLYLFLQRMNFIKCLDFFLTKRNSLSKRMRFLAKDIKKVLKINFFTKFYSIIRFNISHVSLVRFYL